MAIFGYLFLIAALAYSFLIWQFPYERVKKSLQEGLSGVAPIEVSISQVRPGFPLHLQVENVSIRSGPFNWRVPDLNLRPRLLSLIGGKVEFDLEEKDNPESVQGRVWLTDWWGKDRGGIDLRLKQLGIKNTGPPELTFQAKMSGEASFLWTGAQVRNGQAWALLEREGKGSTATIPFDTLRLEVQARDGAFQVKRLEFSGKNLPSLSPLSLFPAK